MTQADKRENFYEDDAIGTIHTFSIWQGVEVGFYDLHVWDWEEDDADLKSPNIIEINHCYAGRYECEFEDNSLYYMGEGNLAVSQLSARKKASGFPLGIYKGVNILIDLDQCEDFFAVLREFEIDPGKITEKWRALLPCRIYQESDYIKHIFDELYGMEKRINYGYVKCKLTELMLLFDQYEYGMEKALQHFSRWQVEKVKHIRTHLEEELERELTLSELAKEHEISESTIKRCFQAVYGKSPSQYRKEFRMQAASKKLIETDESIAEIGMEVGYLNPSKFSSAFQSIMHKTPSAYRNDKKPK